MKRNQKKTRKCKYNLALFVFFLIITPALYAQENVSGIVKGSGNLPLNGATITNKSSGIITITGADGTFEINTNKNDLLEFSFVGYTTTQVRITETTTLDITLVISVVNLDDVVIIGYTSQKIKEISGSVTVVKSSSLNEQPVGQAEQMLQGKVAGLNVITSGMPGGASNVRLHGIGNFGDVTPLYIIDGVPGNINSLNPTDIESIQVLKDAGAYAIYGVRGANGVIVITTKSGKPGRPKVSYEFYAGTVRPLSKSPELLNPQEMADLTWLALKNSGQVDANGNPSHPLYGNGANPVLPDYFISGENIGYFENDPQVNPDLYNRDFTKGWIYQITRANKSGTDWFHELFKPAFIHNHSLTVSAANEKSKYLFSASYSDHQGTALNTYLKRYTLRINTTFSVNEHLRIGENLQLSYRDNPQIATQQGPNENEIFRSIITPGILPVYDINGGWAHFDPQKFAENPVAMRVIAKDSKANNWEIFGNAYAEADFLKHFTLRTSFGGNFNYYYFYNYTFNTYNGLTGGIPDNALSESSGYYRSWTWTNTVNYTNQFLKNHSIKLLAGTEAINNYNRENGGRSIGFFTNDINYRFLSNGDPSRLSNYSFAGNSTLFSIIGRMDYAYKEKLYLTGTIRKDGSSVFGPRHRYGWFPSVSAAWRMTEEKFLASIDWITELKLRGSWGKTGFYGNTDPFNQFTLYGKSIGESYYDIFGTNAPLQGFRQVRIGDPATGWQEDIVTNAGFESVFWNGSLSVTADWYKKKAKGLLFSVTLPDILGGATAPNTNVGIVQNTGIDILIGSKGNLSKDWGWDFTLTFTSYKNKILRLNNLSYFIPDFNRAGPFVRNETGHPIGSFYGLKIIGLFENADEINKSPVQPDAAPGRFKYFDANNDGIIDESNDRVFFGNPHPKFTTGISIGFSYENFDFSTFCYGSFGNDVINETRFVTDFYVTGNTAKSKSLLYDSWTPQHTNTRIPVAENTINFSNIGPINSYLLEKGTYFRNKSIIIGYNFSKKTLHRVKMDRLRVYLQALNIFTITNYSGLDPELSGYSDAFGIDFGNYPNNQKQYLIGVKVVF